MKQLTEFELGGPRLLTLKTGEVITAFILKNDLLSEKVYHKGERLIFECEIAQVEPIKN